MCLPVWRSTCMYTHIYTCAFLLLLILLYSHVLAFYRLFCAILLNMYKNMLSISIWLICFVWVLDVYLIMYYCFWVSFIMTEQYMVLTGIFVYPFVCFVYLFWNNVLMHNDVFALLLTFTVLCFWPPGLVLAWGTHSIVWSREESLMFMLWMIFHPFFYGHVNAYKTAANLIMMYE